MWPLETHKTTFRPSVQFWTGFICVLVFFCLNITGALRFFPGDLGDGRFNMYILEHGFRFLTGNVSEYWNAPFMYPEPALITFSDNLLGIVPFYSLFRGIGAGREVAFILLFILLSLLNYVSCYHLLKYMFGNCSAAALGAMVFAFSIALQSQVSHAQTFPRFPIPLALFFALQFLDQFRPRHFLLLGTMVAWQFYCGIYLGFLLFVPLAMFCLVGLIIRWKQFLDEAKKLRWWTRIIAGAAGVVVIMLPLMIPYLRRAAVTGYHEYSLVLKSVPELISRLYSRGGSLFWDFLSHLNNDHPFYWDDQLFAGGVAVGCFAVFTVLMFTRKNVLIEKRWQTAVILIAGWITFMLFTRVGEQSFYKLLYKNVPGYASMKAVQRIVNIELLFFATAVAFTASYLIQKTRRELLVFFAGAALLVADNYVKPSRTDRTDRLRAAERVQYIVSRYDHTSAKRVLAYEPQVLTDNSIHYHLDAMLASQELGVPTVNGYSANCPHEFGPYWITPDAENRRLWLKARKMDSRNVQVIK